MKPNYTLDACALIAFLANEKGADKVEEILYLFQNKNVSLYMYKINLLEIYYGIEKFEGKSKADDNFNQIVNLRIKIIDKISEDILFKASYYKSNYKISLGDSIALATA